MAMQFNTNNTGTVYTAATAIDAFRLGLMVNPTTGANVSRAVADQRTDVEAVFGFTTEAEQDANILTISTTRNPAAGSYAITDRIIIIDGANAQLAAIANGAHVSFYNCRIMIRSWSLAAGVVLTPPIGTFASAGTTGAGAGGRETPTNFLAPTTGRSINCYGCTIAIADEAATADLHGNVFGNFGDFIGSDITFEGPSVRPGGNFVTFTYQTGGRFINSRHICNPNSTASQGLQGYSFSSVFEGASLYSCGMTSGNATTATSAGSGPRLLQEAQFTYDDQVEYFFIQADARSGWNQGANSFLQLGFKTPSSNDDRTGVIRNGSFQSGTPSYIDIVNGAGAVYNFAGYLPTYQDLATGNPVENVRVRVATSALRGSATPTASNNWHSQLVQDNTEKTLGTTFYANEYLTDATGQLVTSRSTLNGWTSASTGSYDPFRFDTRTAVGSAQLASLDLDTIVLNAPEHCAPVLLQNIRGTATGTGSANAGFTRHQARYEARSYTHAVSEDFTESSTTLPDGSARDVNTDYGIDRTVRNDNTRAGVIKATEALALAEFDTAGNKEAQDVFEFIVANWAQYTTNVEPEAVGSSFTWNGAFTLSDLNAASTVTNTAATINRISELVAGNNINTLGGTAIIVDTDIDGVSLRASGNINLGVGNTITGATLTAASYTNFPTTLDGSIIFIGTHTVTANGTLNVTDVAAVDGLNLVVNAGVTLNVTGAVEADFASVTGAGTVNYLFSTTITADVSNGIITIRKADGTYLNYPNVNSQIISSADLPGGTHRAIVTAKGRSAVPVEIVVDGSTDFALTSTDLGPLGYSPLVDIGTTRTYARVTFDSRQVVRTTETGKNNYYTNPLESARWFGDLYGEQATNEVILDNFALTGSSEMFTLTPSNNVATINLPLVQAYHGTGVTGVLTFSANDALAKGVDADYEMTDGFTANITATAGQGVNSVPNTVGGLSGTITTEIDRSIDAINNNTDAEVAQVDSKVDDMWRNRLLGIKPQPSRDS